MRTGGASSVAAEMAQHALHHDAVHLRLPNA